MQLADQINTGAANEVVVDGGETAFVLKIVRDSLVLKDRVRYAVPRWTRTWPPLTHESRPCRRWYTSLLGKKSSMNPVLAELKTRNVWRQVPREYHIAL